MSPIPSTLRSVDKASFRSDAEAVSRWLGAYAVWRARVPMILSPDPAGTPSLQRWIGTLRLGWKSHFSRAPEFIRPTPNASGELMPSSS